MLTVRAAPPAHYLWLKRFSGCALTDDFQAVEAIDNTGRIRGMVGYCLWAPNSVQAHMATTSPIVWRSLLGPALRYPFEQIGVRSMLATVPASNSASILFALHVGFREVHRIQAGWTDGEDLAILQLERDSAARWMSANRRAA